MAAPASVEEYLAGLSPEVREQVEAAWERVRAAVPDAEAVIAYGIPTLRVGGRSVVHLAGWKAHLSLYPVPEGPADLVAECAPYLSGQGTLKLPYAGGVPLDLVGRVAAALAAGRDGSWQSTA